MNIRFSPAQRAGLLTLLSIAVLLSSLAVAYSGYLNRQSFIELKYSLSEYSRLQVTYGRLQLEKSSWISPAVVQAHASKNFGMQAPSASQTVVIVPPEGIAGLQPGVAQNRGSAGFSPLDAVRP